MAWRGLLAMIAVLIATPESLEAQVQFIGQELADVRVELGGAPLVEPAVLELIETRVGEPLSMEHVRETIEHLVGLGRFEDIRVFADYSDELANGVTLRWTLVPVQRVSRIAITGHAGFDDSVIRAEVVGRLGPSPPTTRLEEVAAVLGPFYENRGYRHPTIRPSVNQGRAPGDVELTLAIDAGPRTTIADVTVHDEEGQAPATISSELRLERGRPFDRPTIDARIAEVENDLRGLGHYEARIEVVPVFSEDGATVNLRVDVDRGPRVRVVFAGDPLPENRRNTLVPIRQERSVDLDLLEDASRNIEAYLRQEGYRSADASYVREQKAGEMVLTYTVTRGPLHRLASIDLSGNTAVPRAEVAPLLPLKAGEPFVDSRIATVASAVTELYRVRGYAGASVKPDIEVLPPRTDDGQTYRPVAVRLVVTEGTHASVGAVSIAGAAAIGDARIRPLLALTPGRPYYRPQLEVDRDAIERLYHNEGYRDARVDAQASVRDGGAHLDVQWSIREGPRTLVDHVLVSGNQRTSGDLIRREIGLKPGMPLGDEALLEAQRRLVVLGLFRRVRINEVPHAVGSSRDVLIEVEEAPTTTVDYGGGVEAGRRVRTSDTGQAEDRIEVAPRGFFQISRRNLWGKNRSISFFTRVSLRARDPAIDSEDPTDEGGYGFNEYRVLATFREPRLFNTAADLQFTGFLEQAIRPSFNFTRRGVRAEYARRLRPALTLSGRYALDKTRLFDEKIPPEDQLLIDRLFPQVRLSTVTAGLLHDSRNDVIDPERGSVVGVDGTVAPRALGSEVGFVKSFVQAFAYRRVPRNARLIFAGGIRLGIARGFERTVERLDDAGEPVIGPDGQPIVDVVNDVPASERFFAGGDSTVRGFVLDRLGTDETLDDQGFPTGGNGLVVINLELRTSYWKGLGGVGFFDTGNVFRRASDISFGDLRPTAGFGLRYRSPLGPLRVDLGFNLDPQILENGARERGTVFHISLGQAF